MSVSPDLPPPGDHSFELRGLPGGLNRPDLSSLTEAQIEFCERWYRLVNDNLPAELHPRAVTKFTEMRFAHAVHDLVANHIEVENDLYDLAQAHLPRNVVQRRLTSYYERFPATKPLNEHELELKRKYQDSMVQTVTEQLELYPELNIVSALRRAFRSRGLVHPTRAMYGLVSAMGHALRDQESR